MKLIVGLGNPGDIYKDSRHNIGFFVVRAIAKSRKAILKRDSAVSSLTAKVKLDGRQVVLALPLTFMNLSGAAVKALLKKYKVNLAGLLVICDDLDLELARIKIKPEGSSGGHNGLQSIIDRLKTQSFARLRIGIGRPKNIDPVEYVLSNFSKKDSQVMKGAIEKAVEVSQLWAAEGTEKCMNLFNRKGAG